MEGKGRNRLVFVQLIQQKSIQVSLLGCFFIAHFVFPSENRISFLIPHAFRFAVINLFAEKWDGLCFYSIYCWMKPLLYSRFDGRISFKNQILRQILKETDTNLYQKYHKQYYEYIAHKADNYNKEKEVIDMTEYLVLTNDSDSFAQLYECIEKEGNINFCTVFVNLIHEYEDETINFLTQLCQKYYEFDSLIIQDTIESLSLSDDYLDHTLAKKLFSKTNLTVPIKQLKNGNSFIWMAYRPRIENMLASYISNKNLAILA